jgi:hypothetical protein
VKRGELVTFIGYVNFRDGRIVSIDKQTHNTVVSTEYGNLEIHLEQGGIKSGDDMLMVIRPESVSLSLDCVTGRQNVICGTLKSYIRDLLRNAR